VHALGPAKGSYGYSAKFTQWMREHLDDYDLVVMNGIWNYHSYGAYRAIRGTKKPYFVFTHGMLDPYFNKISFLKRMKKAVYWHLFEKQCIQNATAVMFTCEEERILARQSYRGFHCTEQVASFGTADPKVDLAACRAEFLSAYPQLAGKRMLLFLSRIDPKKGIDLLIQAAARLKGGYKDVVYVIAGPDNAGIQGSLVSLAEKLGVSDQIIWPGMLTGNMKWGAFAAAEAFILPSHQENFGIVLAESMACGKPVLTTNKVNIWHEVEEFQAGLVANDDTDGIASLLTKWLSASVEERARYGANARACFEQKFEAKQSAKCNYEIYRSRTTEAVAK
jgi:glycosyltransferase involved in cell wall biosynthesis